MNLNNFFLINMSLEKYVLLMILFISAVSLITYFINNFFIKLRLLDIPNERKSHAKPTPISGGTILVTLVLTIIFYLVNFTKINVDFYFNIILVSLIFFILGFIDDLKNPRTTIKIIIILIILVISLIKYKGFVISELRFNYIYNLNISLGYFAIPFSLFCIFMFFNALNYSDGKNGVCISYSIFIFIFVSSVNDNIKIFDHFIILSLIILLIFNLKNKLFLGNGGVNFLSIFLSLLIIKTYNLNEGNFFCDEIFLLMLIPGIDAARVTIFRIYKKISPLSPDKRHFHHYLSKFVNDSIIWLIYLFLSSIPIIILIFTSNFLISILVPVIMYIFLILRSSKQ